MFCSVKYDLADSQVQHSAGLCLQHLKKSVLDFCFVTQYFHFLFSGLLLPRVGVEHHGIDRTDGGNLGSGIYFGDAVWYVEHLGLTSFIL